MKAMFGNIKSWFGRWGVKVAWLAAVVAVIAVAIVRCNHSKPASVSSAMTDSLQCISVDGLQRLDYCGFRVYFNSQWHLPACVAYELTLTEAAGTHPRHNSWIADDSVTGCPGVDDYKNSGYDRGHMVPAGDLKWSEQAMTQSFTMTNACPQNHALNEGGWAKLEEKVREWVMRDSALVVLTGPIVGKADTATVGPSRVRVPGAFYKIVLAHHAHPMRVVAFIYPNRPCERRLADYNVTVRDIEQRTGINFFQCLPQEEQDRLETTRNLNPWLY